MTTDISSPTGVSRFDPVGEEMAVVTLVPNFSQSDLFLQIEIEIEILFIIIHSLVLVN